MKTKINLSRSGLNYGKLTFEENSFFRTQLEFTLFWYYKRTDAIDAECLGSYPSEKIIKLSTNDKLHFKSNIFNGSKLNAIREPMLCSFNLDKPPGWKFFFQPERVSYRRMDKFVLNTITIGLEDDNHAEGNFNGETLTFTLQLIKIWTNKWAFKNIKLIRLVFDKNTTLVQTTLLVR